VSAARTARATAARIPAAAGAVSLEDLEGRRLRLDSLWRDAPVVLVFLRHFG
jgi:hypothetical protein